jgi:hypothetical protein
MAATNQDSGLDIRWNREIDLYHEQLVELADKTLSKGRVEEIKRDLKLAQLGNLLGVAQESSSVAPVDNWIQYQMGRRDTSRAWRQSNFGNDVLKDFATISGYAKAIVRNVYGQSGEARKVQATHITLVRLYIGYLRRWFVARGGQN